VAKAPAIVLSIAGFDPSSGAGITADLKTIAAHGLFGISCITALTVQSTQGVAEVHPVAPGMVRRTLEVLFDDFRPEAIKIGMLANPEVAEVVAYILRQVGPPNVVLDPIIRSSSGAKLLDDAGTLFLRDQLISLADVITPNLEEAQQLVGMPVRTLPEMRAAARELHRLGAKNVVITGGHLDQPTDVLCVGTRTEPMEFPGDHITTDSTHGTGCAFASAVACNLALGKSIVESVRAAKAYVSQALKLAYSVGKGKSPLNHLFRFEKDAKTT
jgi:hydroxymethylpyrimidine/phosphomethylpyrimidine kinase